MLDAILGPLSDWLRDIRKDRQAAKDKAAAEADQRAAQILQDATILVAVMQEYDNSARRAYDQAFLFAAQEPATDEDPAVREERRRAYRSLQDFEYGRQLLGEAVRVLGPLRDWPQPLATPAEQGFLTDLVQCGQEFVRLTSDVRDAKVKYSEEAQHGYGTAEYMRAMASGSVSAAVARYAARMSARIAPLQQLRDRADLAYGNLCAALRQRHNLPPLPRTGS